MLANYLINHIWPLLWVCNFQNKTGKIKVNNHETLHGLSTTSGSMAVITSMLNLSLIYARFSEMGLIFMSNVVQISKNLSNGHYGLRLSSENRERFKKIFKDDYTIFEQPKRFSHNFSLLTLLYTTLFSWNLPLFGNNKKHFPACPFSSVDYIFENYSCQYV